MARIKITVVKKHHLDEDFGENLPCKVNREMLTPECHLFQVGQEFFLDSSPDAPASEMWHQLPSGFCPWAFADIQRDIMIMLFGGNYPWIAEEGVIVTCCTDGLRPVIFRVERVAG